MIKYAIAVCAALSLAGCATITRGTDDVLVVQSVPAGAQVKMSNSMSCNSTPCNFKVPRKSELNVLVTKEGCKPQTIRVTNVTASGGGAAMAGNVIAGGVVGIVVDGSSGATQDLSPNPVVARLECRK